MGVHRGRQDLTKGTGRGKLRPSHTMPIGLIVKNYHFSKPLPKEPEKPEPKPDTPKRPTLHLKNAKK